jgi:hypothetical protein
LGIWFFHLSRRTTVIQDLLVRRQFSLVPDNRTNVNVDACRIILILKCSRYFICSKSIKKMSIFTWRLVFFSFI